LAEVVDEYVRKGSQIYVEGRLRTREWTDKDNIKRYTTEIMADEMKLLGRRSDNQQAGAPMGGQQGYSQQQGGYSQNAGGYQQSEQYVPQSQPASAATIPAPQDDPDDLPF
jgi:single-strand DNA-binding protein